MTELMAEGIGFWDWELTEGNLIISPEWLAMMGYTKEDLPDLPKMDEAALGQIINAWSAYVHPDDRKEAEKTLIDFLILRKSHSYNNQFRFRKKDNSYIRIYSNGYAVWEGKKLIRFRVNHVDITELGGFDKAMLVQFRYIEENSKEQTALLKSQLIKQRRLSILVVTIFGILLLWISGFFPFFRNFVLLSRENRINPISTVNGNPIEDIVNFPAFYRNKDEISEALTNHIGIYADRAVFGYYESGPSPQRGRIGAQAKRQSVEINVTEEPWLIDDATLIDRRDSHLKGQTYLINNPFLGLYDAGFQISAPGFYVSGDAPAIAWFVGIECEPDNRLCDEDRVDIKSLKKAVDEILNAVE